MLKKVNVADAFRAVKDWTSQAWSLDADQYPDLDLLRYVLEKRASIVDIDAEASVYKNIAVIGFQVVGGQSVGLRRRHVLPVHFAIMRALELVPGVRIRLNDDAHKAYHRKQGNERTPDDLIFTIGIHFEPALAEEFGLPKRSRLDRILFDAPPDAKLLPRRSGDHHYIVPSNSIPIRTRTVYAQTQETWLEVAERSIQKAALEELRELPAVLRALFVTSDRWHREELADRKDTDPRVCA